MVDESNQNSGSRNDIGSQKSFFDTIDDNFKISLNGLEFNSK